MEKLALDGWYQAQLDVVLARLCGETAFM